MLKIPLVANTAQHLEALQEASLKTIILFNPVLNHQDFYKH